MFTPRGEDARKGALYVQHALPRGFLVVDSFQELHFPKGISSRSLRVMKMLRRLRSDASHQTTDPLSLLPARCAEEVMSVFFGADPPLGRKLAATGGIRGTSWDSSRCVWSSRMTPIFAG